MKESEDPDPQGTSRPYPEGCRMFRKDVSESGLKEQMHESKSFHMREFNAILGSLQSLRTAQSFFESVLEHMDLSWSDLDAQALAEAELDFGQPLAMCPVVPQRGKAVVRRPWHSCGVSFPSFLKFLRKVGSGGLFCLEEEPFPGRAELLFFCL